MNRSKIIHISAAIIGSTVIVGAAYYYWYRKSSVNKAASETAPVVVEQKEAENRVVAGRDEDAKSMDLFNIEDERVRDVFERLFREQITLGEELINDDETLERGAIHLANAVALTGEADKLLSILRQTFPVAKFSRILKYMPTAELRVDQMLQDELENEAIAAIFN